VAIELTSKSTRHADTKRKFELYRDILKIKEYFLFDPFDDYLVPRFQGYRLRGGDYTPIKMSSGRMHSDVLDLNLAPVLDELRLFDSNTGRRLETPLERIERADTERLQTQAALDRSQAAVEKAQAEIVRLRDRLTKHGLNGGNGNAS
jgi:Putative restriction endonuclease